MCEGVWKQVEMNDLIKTIKFQPIHCSNTKAGEKSTQAMLDFVEVLFWVSNFILVLISAVQFAQRILNTGKEDVCPQIQKHFSVLRVNTLVKLKHIHQFKGFFTFALKYSCPSLLDPLWIWISEGKSQVTAP